VQLANDRQHLLVTQSSRRATHLQLLRAMNMRLDTELDLTDKLEYAPVDSVTLEAARKQAQLVELEEEHGGEDGAFADLEKVSRGSVLDRLAELRHDPETEKEAVVYKSWLELNERETLLKRKLKQAAADLDAKAYDKYPKLSDAEIKALVVDYKWMATLEAAIHGEMDRASQALTSRVVEIAERYERPMPDVARRVADLGQIVNRHLENMGFSWNSNQATN
jgi:type I restriction enzyme M protein